jgi:hypothetical protein
VPERQIGVLPQRLLRSDRGKRDGDDGSWEFENALLFHSATILVVVVLPCPTCKRRIVLIAVVEI